jgi:hypothetical protein
MWVSTWLWGALVGDATVDCPYGGIVQMDTTTLVPMTVLTLGIWTPIHVSWMCERPRRTLDSVNAGP